jgi:hypothetical protein
VTRGLSTFGFRDGKLAVVESVNRAGCRQAHHRRDETADAGRSGRSGVRSAGAGETVGISRASGALALEQVTPPAISFESYDSMKTSSPSIRAARRRGNPIHAAYSGTIALAYTWKGAAKGDPLS